MTSYSRLRGGYEIPTLRRRVSDGVLSGPLSSYSIKSTDPDGETDILAPPEYAGFTLIKDVPLNYDYGWSHALGKEHISAAYCHPSHTVFGPDGMTIQERKRTSAWVWNGYQIWSNSADVSLHKSDCILPNYFRARCVWTTTHLHNGLFPAIWFCVEGPGDGEIDWHEYLGGHNSGGGYLNKVTLISTPYNVASLNQDLTNRFNPAGLSTPNTDNTWLIGVDRVMEIEKTPNRVRTWCDGILMTDHKRGVAGTNGSTMTTANWDRCFEVNSQKWYFRFTGQLEDDVDGSPSGNAGKLPSTWTWTDITIKALQFWAMDV